MPGLSTKTGHFLAKALGIKLDYRHQGNTERTTRGESVFSVQTADSFVEQDPTTVEWIRETIPGRHDFVQYCRSLFPFTHWIGRYNLQWFWGDLVAGLFSRLMQNSPMCS